MVLKENYIAGGSAKTELQYADILQEILTAGVRQHNRTGIDTLSIEHAVFEYDCRDGLLPVLRGKKMFPYLAVKELLWMLSGRTDIKWLNDRGVSYWDDWTLPDGTIGKSYGWQFRHFNGKSESDPEGIDQLSAILNEMTADPLSRRLAISLWNPSQLSEMALPPCVHGYHFSCMAAEGESNVWDVTLHVTQRSADMFLGVPYDFIFCAVFLDLVCDFCNKSQSANVFRPAKIFHTADNVHIYVNALGPVRQYLANVRENKGGIISDPVTLTLNLQGKYGNIDSYLSDLDTALCEKMRGVVCITKKTPDAYGPVKAELAV